MLYRDESNLSTLVIVRNSTSQLSVTFVIESRSHVPIYIPPPAVGGATVTITNFTLEENKIPQLSACCGYRHQECPLLPFRLPTATFVVSFGKRATVA